MGRASTFVAIYHFAINFGTAASHDGWRSAVTDAAAKQQQQTNQPKHTATSKKCANGTCAKCFIKERFARHNSYQGLSDEGNDEFGDW